MAGEKKVDPYAEFGSESRHPDVPIPREGNWPCQQPPVDEDTEPRLVGFLYRLLRDGAPSPGDVEAHLVQVIPDHAQATYTNLHLWALARAHAAFLLQDAMAERLKAIREAVDELQGLVHVDGDLADNVACEDVAGVLTAMDFILRGDPGCNEPDEVPWAGRRKF